MGRLDNKVAVITGAASGMGAGPERKPNGATGQPALGIALPDVILKANRTQRAIPLLTTRGLGVYTKTLGLTPLIHITGGKTKHASLP
jgi:hypothetical protein